MCESWRANSAESVSNFSDGFPAQLFLKIVRPYEQTQSPPAANRARSSLSRISTPREVSPLIPRLAIFQTGEPAGKILAPTLRNRIAEHDDSAPILFGPELPTCYVVRSRVCETNHSAESAPGRASLHPYPEVEAALAPVCPGRAWVAGLNARTSTIREKMED